MNVTHKILLVDDDKDDLLLLEEALKESKNGFSLVVAHDGSEALERLYELRKLDELPCLIVMDVNMPKLDGRETYKAIKSIAEFAAIPIVIFSTSSKEEYKEEFAGRNTRCITKPINFNKLVETANTMLGLCERHVSG